MFFFRPQRARKPARQSQGFRPTLEALEDRTVPGSIAGGLAGGSWSGPVASALLGRPLIGNGTNGAPAVLTGNNHVGSGNTGANNLGSGNLGNFAAASAPTIGVVPAAADEVSGAVARLFGTYGQEYQALSTQAAAFHD